MKAIHAHDALTACRVIIITLPVYSVVGVVRRGGSGPAGEDVNKPRVGCDEMVAVLGRQVGFFFSATLAAVGQGSAILQDPRPGKVVVHMVEQNSRSMGINDVMAGFTFSNQQVCVRRRPMH